MVSISKRVSGAWQNTSYGIRATATDTITMLPTTIYGDGTNATVSIKGNTVQSGTPTPDNPIMLQGTGNLETVGAKAGQYKIPILSANTTTPVYLGEVQTTRKIGKYIFTGEENIARSASYSNTRMYYVISSAVGASPVYCSHFIDYAQASAYPPAGYCNFNTISNFIMGVNGTEFETADDFKVWLAAQYAAGTPVTVWYVLAEPETGIVNEPLMKIEDYADEVNNISIPTTDGANTLSVDTTVQPSEVSVNYHGWHMGTVHERTAGQWD